MGLVTVGIDIGQKIDPTAIAVVEQEWRGANEAREDHSIVRAILRLPLGTSYVEITARLAEIVANVRQRGVVPRRVFVDATGVGTPVVDELKKAGVRVTAVYFTHGDRRTVAEDGNVTLGKAYLVSRMKALMQTDRLHLPRTDEAEAMQRELLDYEIRVSEDANDRYGAFRVGSHDDMVTAIGLAVQEPVHAVPAPFSGPPQDSAHAISRMMRHSGAPQRQGAIDWSKR